MNQSSPPSTEVASRGLRCRRIALAVVTAAVVSAIVGGSWSLAGLPGSPGPVFGIVFASLMVFGGVFSGANAAVRGAARRTIEERFPRGDFERATDMANNFGVTSKGPAQLRGNGALVLTRETLLFIPLVGDDIAIPRASVQSTSIVRTHLGKWVGRPLLRVDYGDDSIAFYVDDPQSWAASLSPSARTAPQSVD